MFDKNELEKMNLKNLQEIAEKNKVIFTKETKKNEIISLILENQKVTETAVQKKIDLSDNPTSQSSSLNQSKEYKKDFFSDVLNLPQSYNKDKIVFMVRDPYWGFVYWEITESLYAKFEAGDFDKYLRVYDINGGKNPETANSYFDIKLTLGSNNWYIKFPSPNTTYIIDIGFFKDGKFVTLLRSNPATTPRDEVSDQVDVEWMISEEMMKKLLRASGADQLFQQTGSQELMKFLAGNIAEENKMSSGLMPSSFTNPNLSSSSISSSMNRK